MMKTSFVDPYPGLERVPTAVLVEELKKREGVMALGAAPHDEIYEVNILAPSAQRTPEGGRIFDQVVRVQIGDGPVVILIVED